MSSLDKRGDDECCDSITELPSVSLQLQHLVKGRPKRAKTRAPSRPLVADTSTREIIEGLDQFFRPGSVTPTTLTPLVSPTSEECSSLSFADSPTMSRDDNGRMTSEETTPILEERKPIKLDRSSPLLRGVAWASRSRSTDNLEKYSPLIGRKSPLVKMRTEGNEDRLDRLHAPYRDDRMRSPSSESIKSHTGGDSVIVKTGNGILRTPIVLQKPRPWSVVGNEPKSGDFSTESSKTTPEQLEDDCDVVPFGQQTGGSIVGISPGIALASSGGGGSIVGITPGAALEKKSVRELAAGLSRIDLPMKPPPIGPRPASLLNSSNSSSTSNNTSRTIITSSSSTTTTTSSVTSGTIENVTKTLITAVNSESLENLLASGGVSEKKTETVVKRIAGKEITSIFEETLVEGLQRSSVRRTFRDAQYTKDDVVDV